MSTELLLRPIVAGKERWLGLLRTLVNTDSGSYDKPGVDAVGNIVAGELTALGFAVDTIPEPEHGDHRRARKVGGYPRVLLVGHMDTVFERGTARARPFAIRDGQGFGPGVLDMKGGLVAMLAALLALRETKSPIFEQATITVFLNSEEEILSPRSRPHLEAEAQQADLAIVFEPARPGGEYVTRRKAVGKFKLSVHGRAAHAGVQPEYGASAIHELAYKITAFQKLPNLAAGTTINVGVIRGGERANVVAPYAEAEVDLRAWTQADAESAIAAMREVVARPEVQGTQALLEGGFQFPAMERKEGSIELFSCFQAAAQELGLTVRDTETGGGSDGNHISIHTKTLDGAGPVGAYAHSPDEFVEVETIFQRAAIAGRALEVWLERYGRPVRTP